MKTDQLLKYGARHRMTPGDFAKMLTAPPHNLTCVEATQLMKEYQRNYPEMAGAVNLLPFRADTEVIRASVRLPVLINRKAVKELALDVSASKRAGKFERVGKSFLDAIEAEVRLLVSRRVMGHPSKGKTLK